MIRPLRPEDAEELAALLAVNREFLRPFEPARPEAFFTAEAQRERLERPREDSWLFGIVDGDALAGTVSLANTIRGPLQSANLGYWIDRARNGGLATAAVADAVAFAFGRAGLHRVEAGTLPDNAASQRVLEKNGFEQIGLARRFLRIGDVWRDHLLFQRVAD